MHEWHTSESTNIVQLIDDFTDFEYHDDYGCNSISYVNVSNRVFKTPAEARDYVTRLSYGSDNTAVLAAYTTKKLTKAYQNAFDAFIARRKEYYTFKRQLNIGYGRKASKVTCPECDSSISLKHGKHYKKCPVCHSEKIISDSNWKSLETKNKLMRKAGDALSKEAAKNGVTFLCGIEWHC